MTIFRVCEFEFSLPLSTVSQRPNRVFLYLSVFLNDFGRVISLPYYQTAWYEFSCWIILNLPSFGLISVRILSGNVF